MSEEEREGKNEQYSLLKKEGKVKKRKIVGATRIGVEKEKGGGGRESPSYWRWRNLSPTYFEGKEGKRVQREDAFVV